MLNRGLVTTKFLLPLTTLLIVINSMSMSGCSNSSPEKSVVETDTAITATVSVEGASRDLAGALWESEPFDEVRFELQNTIMDEQQSLLSQIENAGVDIYSDYPYCIPTWPVLFGWVNMIRASSAENFDIHYRESLFLSDVLERTLEDTRHKNKVEWSPEESKAKCDEVKEEIGVRRGLISPTSVKGR